MTKQETINRYKDEFLAGKTPEYIERFLSKDMLKQYGSIMTWRRKNRKKQILESTAQDVLDYLEAARKMIDELPSLSQEEIEKLKAQLLSLSVFLDEKAEEKRMAEIEELEKQKEEISRRLSQLRGNNEPPTLF